MPTGPPPTEVPPSTVAPTIYPFASSTKMPAPVAFVTVTPLMRALGVLPAEGNCGSLSVTYYPGN